GKPVVVGDSGGAADTVLHGTTGYLVDPYNPVAVGVHMVGLLTNAQDRVAMGAAGRKWVESEWGWDRSGVVLRELLDV
ncbi:MAG TPA: glycosyltransferase, partial [Kribbella sp.]|nr:glycosyltransferase [Kribbella sp.]